MPAKRLRGEVWLANFDPVEGREQGRNRPCLVLSDDVFNHGPSGMLMVVPITSKQHAVPIRVPLAPPEGGLKTASFAMPEMLRAISTNRLVMRWGLVSGPLLNDVEESVRTLLLL